MLSDRLETFTSELLTTFFNPLPFVVTSLLSIIRCYPKSPVSGDYVAHAQTFDTSPSSVRPGIEARFPLDGRRPPAPIRLQYFKWTAHTHLTPATCEFCIPLDWLRGVTNTHFNKWYSSLLANTHLNITIFIRYCVTGQNKTVDKAWFPTSHPAQREVGDARLGSHFKNLFSGYGSMTLLA